MLLNLLFPKFCIFCKTFGKNICNNCRKKVVLCTNNKCTICNRPTILGLNHEWCKGELDGVFCIFEYKTPIKEIIKTIKYNLAFSLWKETLDLIPNTTISQIKNFKNDIGEVNIQPIPLHTQRLKQRGFNQVEPFASFISKQLQSPLVHMLKRRTNTTSQVSVKEKTKRAQNIEDAFYIPSYIDIKKQKFILIDDVFTTGNTCIEAAKTLKKKGAEKVYALTLAKD
ncbi:MAG TPA: phosphoribosyltransferase family protein [Candidatus Woesebacteria bacterium]|nr:phosphoribosyltransferase family protein [Candidatus Woesebacteria bacterium]